MDTFCRKKKKKIADYFIHQLNVANLSRTFLSSIISFIALLFNKSIKHHSFAYSSLMAAISLFAFILMAFLMGSILTLCEPYVSPSVSSIISFNDSFSSGSVVLKFMNIRKE